jgi:hypothetical protein
MTTPSQTQWPRLGPDTDLDLLNGLLLHAALDRASDHATSSTADERHEVLTNELENLTAENPEA